ncbi:MAG: hypothetical protein MUD14_20635, partial [Hydrococcus sp. Prado102]|nr:hypothetical protein [Hydrococcus sp. Prado102]
MLYPIETAALNNLTTASSRLVGKYRRDARLANQEKDESEARQLEQSAVQQAQFVAGEVFAYDSLYRWWWLLGRIYRTTGRL